VKMGMKKGWVDKKMNINLDVYDPDCRLSVLAVK